MIWFVDRSPNPFFRDLCTVRAEPDVLEVLRVLHVQIVHIPRRSVQRRACGSPVVFPALPHVARCRKSLTIKHKWRVGAMDYRGRFR